LPNSLLDTLFGFAQNSFKNPGNVPNQLGRKGFKFKRIEHALTVFKRVMKIQKPLVII
jgi:hypothetical protein